MSIDFDSYRFNTRSAGNGDDNTRTVDGDDDVKVNWSHRESKQPERNESQTRTAGGPAPSGSGRSGGSFAGSLDDTQVVAGMRDALANSDTVECFGGLLFRGVNAHKGEIVAHAVDNVGKSEARQLVEDWYYNITTNYNNLFLLYDRSTPLKQSVVFSFRLPAGYRSLRELMGHPQARSYGPMLFRKLIAFLATYEKVTASSGKYRALCCLSLDTVFMHETENDIRVLPLAARNGRFPAYYPGEAGQKMADITTDMYTAALTTLQFMTGSEMESEDTTMADCAEIPCLDDCLRVFQSRRPQLREVQTLLGSRSPDDAAKLRFDKGPDGEPLYQKPKLVNLEELLKGFFSKRKDTFSGVVDDDA